MCEAFVTFLLCKYDYLQKYEREECYSYSEGLQAYQETQKILLQEKLDILAKVEAGEHLRGVARFCSNNECTVWNIVKCNDAVKNAVKETSPKAMDNIVKVNHGLYVSVMEKALF